MINEQEYNDMLGKKTISITGAGTRLGKGAAIGLAQKGHKVIATVETISQALPLQDYAKE